jgi:SAM-dependent methyltransferase
VLNWIMRYQPVIKLLDELGAEKVLDVGSGWYGLSWYWPHNVVQTDLYFTGNAPSPVERAGTAQFVPATAEELPFADKSFDYAVSLDMMEHLPAGIRGKAVAELARVSRTGFMIGYPVGDAAAGCVSRQGHPRRRAARGLAHCAGDPIGEHRVADGDRLRRNPAWTPTSGGIGGAPGSPATPAQNSRPRQDIPNRVARTA